LSKIYEKAGQLEEAYDSARESAMTDIKNSEAFLQYARMSLKIGDNERALTCLKKVLNLDPSNKEAQEIIKIFDSEKENN
jgi:tetratricopeptide (TPR) repeat protein